MSQQLLTEAVYVCAVWPSAGIGLAAALLFGRWAYPGIFAGSVVANVAFFMSRLTVTEAASVGALTATGAVAEAAFLRWAVDARLRRYEILERFGPLARFVAWAVLGCTLSSIIGVTTGYAHGQVVTDRLPLAYLIWWCGDLMGVLTVVPFALAVVRPGPDRAPSPDDTWGLRAIFLTAFLCATITAFSLNVPWMTPGLPVVALTLGVLWACFFMPQRWALGATAGMCSVGIGLTTLGYGPLGVREDPLAGGLNSNVFALVSMLSALAVSGGLRRRVRREEAEREAQRERFDIFERSPLGIAWSEADTRRFGEANTRLARLLGYGTPDQLPRGDVLDWLYVRPSDRDTLLRCLKESPDGVAYHKFEVKTADAGRLWLRVDARRVEREGRPHILGFVRDITAGVRRQRFERIVRKLAKRTAVGGRPDVWAPRCLRPLQKQLEAQVVSLWLAVPGETCLRYWSLAAGVETSGVLQAKPASRPDGVEIVRQEARDRRGAADEDIHVVELGEGDGFAGALVIVEPGWLATRPLGRKTSTLLDMIGTTVRRILTQAVERHRVSDELARLVTTREEERRRYAFVTRFAGVGIFEANPAGRTTYLNEAGQELDDVREDDPDRWRDRLADRCKEKVLREWERFTEECREQGREAPITIDEVIQARDGTERVVEVKAVPQWDRGRLLGFVGVLQDVSNLRFEREAALRLSMLSHDIKNALAGLGFALGRLRAICRDPGVAQHLDHAETHRTTITDLTRPALEPARAVFNPKLEVSVALQAVPAAMQAEFVLAPGAPPADECPVPEWVSGDRRVISQVLANLIQNAVDQHTTDPQVRRLWVELAARRAGNGRIDLYVSVEDDGRGLDPEILGRLELAPEELWRWYLSLKRGDRGRGLAHCRFALQRAKGWLLAVPGLNAGPAAGARYSRFTFSLQVEPAEPPTPDAAAMNVTNLPTPRPVLVVDDMVWARTDLASKLLSWGMQPVVACATARDAVDLAQAAAAAGRPFELVLLDLELGVGEHDGYWAARELRKTPTATRPRIVSISMSKPDDPGRRERAGFDEPAWPKDEIRRPADLVALLGGRSPGQPAAQPGQPSRPGVFDTLGPGKATLVCAWLALLGALDAAGDHARFHDLYHQVMQAAETGDALRQHLRAADRSGRAALVRALISDALMEPASHLTLHP